MRTTAGPRVRLAVVGVAAIGALGVLAASGLDDSLVYYRTPTELASPGAAGEAPATDGDGIAAATARPQDGERIRVGGLVEPGSVDNAGERTRFTLTDGASAVPVSYKGTPPGVFQPGQGAIAEGILRGGVLRADTLMVKHSNEYRGPDGEPYATPQADTAGAGL